MRLSPPDGPTEFVIPSDPLEAVRIREHIEARLRFHRYDDRDIFGIRLAVEEALVNAIKHGNGLDARKKVHVHCHIQPHRFDIAITDEGEGFDPYAVPDCLKDENLERPGGRGLLLMRYFMTDVVYHPPGNRLTMSKLRSAPSCDSRRLSG